MVPFRALVVRKGGDEGFSSRLERLTLADLPAGEVTIRVLYSSVNYKDGLAVIPEGKVVRAYPMVPGIDLAGTVVDSEDSRFRVGDPVIAMGHGLGVTHYGGYSEYARVPASWVHALPAGLSLQQAMLVGTAGLTAALAIHRLEANGLAPGGRPVLVTGATGGVGSFAVAMLARRGYQVFASTGKREADSYLRSLGAHSVLSREEVSGPPQKPLESQRWAAAIDSVGGATLAYCLRTTAYRGAIASIGLAGSAELETTVFPFILRGVDILGIDAAECPMPLRLHLWEQIASTFQNEWGQALLWREVDLDTLPDALAEILRGGVRGRTVVRIAPDS